MKGMKLLLTAIIFLSMMLIFGGEGFSASPSGEKPKVLRIGTSKEGTRGFTFGLALQKVVSPHLQKEGTRLLSLSTAGSEASVVLLSKGEIEIAWDSAFDLGSAGS